MSLDNRKSSQEIRLKLLLPVMQEDKPYQSVQIMNMSPRPCSEIKDRWGNRIAEYSITLPPGDHKDIVIDYRVRLCNYVTDIDWEKIPLRCEYPEEVRPFLLPEGHIESDNPLMKNLSSGITEGEPHSYFQALKIYDHIMDECTFELEREPQSALSALKSRVVQCCDSTLLFIALCRARGIPARYIGGLYLGLEEGDEYDCTHCWAQVYMPAYGWIDADPTQGRHSDERRFVCFAQRRPLYFSIWKGMRDPYQIMTYARSGQKSSFRHGIHFKVEEIKDGSKDTSKSIFRRCSYFDDAFSGVHRSVRQKDEKTISPLALQHFSRAEALSRKGLINDSQKEYEKAIECAPDFNSAHQNYIECHLHSRKLDNALSFYSGKVKRDDRNPAYHYYLGLCYAYKSLYSSALNEFNRSLELGFSEKQFLYNSRGYLYFKTKQLTKAAEDFNQAITFDDGYFTPYGNLIDMFSCLEDWQTLIKLSSKVLVLFPQKEGIWHCLGFACLMSGDYDKAQDALKTAISLKPGDGKLHASLGLVYMEMGETMKAGEEISRGLKLGMKNKDYYQERLKELRERTCDLKLEKVKDVMLQLDELFHYPLVLLSSPY